MLNATKSKSLIWYNFQLSQRIECNPKCDELAQLVPLLWTREYCFSKIIVVDVLIYLSI